MVQIHHRCIFIALVSLGLVACTALGPGNVPNPPDVYEAYDTDKANVEKSDVQPIPFGVGMTPPQQISGPRVGDSLPKPVLGTWVGRCIITEDGSVTKCEIVKGMPDLDEHLLQVLYAQKYTPVIYLGKPQRVFYTFVIKFK